MTSKYWSMQAHEFFVSEDSFLIKCSSKLQILIVPSPKYLAALQKKKVFNMLIQIKLPQNLFQKNTADVSIVSINQLHPFYVLQIWRSSIAKSICIFMRFLLI